jgi:zinc-ribbon domain
MEWFIFWLIINCVVGYLIGQQKNDMATAIVLSILLGPIGWLIAGLSKGNLRKCPHCAEFVKPEATVCRHCGKELPAPALPAAAPVKLPEPPMPKSSKGEKIALAVVLAAIVIGSVIAVLYSGHEKKPQPNGASSLANLQSRSSDVETPQETYYWSLRLTRPVELKNSIGSVIVKLQEGQSIQYVYRDNYVARIRYDGADYEIPISSTDLK